MVGTKEFSEREGKRKKNKVKKGNEKEKRK